MLIKKADVKNHLAAKLKKRHVLRDSTVGQMPAERSSAGADNAGDASENTPKPLSPFSGSVVPIRAARGH